MSRRSEAFLTVVVVVVVALVAACGASDDDAMKFSDVGSAISGDSAGGWTEEVAPDDDGDLYLESGEREGADPSPPDPTSSGDGTGDTTVPVDTVLAAPTAGSVDDNELWDEYLLYRDGFFAKGIPISDLPVAGRQLLTVADVDGDPVLGATIVVADQAGAEAARLRTYADGRAVFLAGTDVDPSSQSRPSYTAQVTVGAADQTFELEPGALAQTLTLEVDVPTPAQVDVLFLIDATGSMSDEIESLKASMTSVAEQIAALPSAPDARFSMVLYRDRGEEYLTRTFDFTGDLGSFTAALADVVADAGGDTPEALGSGLDDAVHGVSWRGDDTVKLTFLLADAAPHLAGEPGYEAEPDYARTLRDAAAAGIKIFPISSSGLDDQGEFAFRQLAQVTMGRFLFLTYGTDGQSPGTSTPHDVDPADYDVLALDALVVQLVSDEMATLPR